jgi:hypothetical protein
MSNELYMFSMSSDGQVSVHSVDEVCKNLRDWRFLNNSRIPQNWKGGQAS